MRCVQLRMPLTGFGHRTPCWWHFRSQYVNKKNALKKMTLVSKFMLILTALGAFFIASDVTFSFSRHSHKLCFWTRADKNMIAAAMQMHAASACSSSVPLLANNEAAKTRVILRSGYLASVVIWYLAYCFSPSTQYANRGRKMCCFSY